MTGVLQRRPVRALQAGRQCVGEKAVELSSMNPGNRIHRERISPLKAALVLELTGVDVDHRLVELPRPAPDVVLGSVVLVALNDVLVENKDAVPVRQGPLVHPSFAGGAGDHCGARKPAPQPALLGLNHLS